MRHFDNVSALQRVTDELKTIRETDYIHSLEKREERCQQRVDLNDVYIEQFQ